MTTVYLSGGMMGLSDDEVHDWRERAKDLLPGHEYLDPTRREWDDPIAQSAELVAGDEADIRRSEVVLVYAPRPSWGTAMEVYMAAVLGLVVVVVSPPGVPMSPWLWHHATEVYDTLEEACRSIREVYDGGNH